MRFIYGGVNYELRKTKVSEKIMLLASDKGYCLYPQFILTVIPSLFKFSIVCTAAKKKKRGGGVAAQQARLQSEQQCVKHKEKEVTK